MIGFLPYVFLFMCISALIDATLAVGSIVLVLIMTPHLVWTFFKARREGEQQAIDAQLDRERSFNEFCRKLHAGDDDEKSEKDSNGIPYL